MNARPLAIITGATAPGRVGVAIARELAAAGCNLVLTHRPGAAPERLADVTRAIASPGVVRFESLDLADPSAAAAWARRLAADLPRIDILVHNAARYTPSPLDRIDPAEAAAEYAVNALAPLAITAALAPALAASPMGQAEGVGAAVVTLCDAHAMGPLGRPRRGHAAYSMSKAALLEMTIVLARDLAPLVRVNALAPGVVAFAPHESAEFQERYLARVPLARAGTPEDAARAVRFLALDATYCTGVILRIDGGGGLS